jgi:hypothetical protein
MQIIDQAIQLRRTFSELYDVVGWDANLVPYVTAIDDTSIKAIITEDNIHWLYNLMDDNKDIRYHFMFIDRFVELVNGIELPRSDDPDYPEVYSRWDLDYTTNTHMDLIECYADHELLRVIGKYNLWESFIVSDHIWVVANDVFYWGCADGEDISVGDIPLLEQSVQDSEKYGLMLYCCRHRKQRPQMAWYKYFSDIECTLFDACGPEDTQYGR